MPRRTGSARTRSASASFARQAAVAHGEQRKRERRQDAERKAAHRVARPAEIRHERDEAHRGQHGGARFDAPRCPVRTAAARASGRTAESSHSRAGRRRPWRSCTAAKNATQCSARIAPLTATRQPADDRPAGCAAHEQRSRASAAAMTVRPSTIAVAGSAIHLPNSAAKPNSATAACSDARRSARCQTWPAWRMTRRVATDVAKWSRRCRVRAAILPADARDAEALDVQRALECRSRPHRGSAPHVSPVDDSALTRRQ